MKRFIKLLEIRHLCLAGMAILVFSLGSCDVFDVENPNSLTEEDVNIPSSAEGLKNGLLNALMTGTGWTYGSTSTISDEVYWTGSYESFKTYDEGRVGFAENEITVAGFPELSQARYMSDLAIERLEAFDADGALSDRSVLAQVYIYAALARITIADSYDDFVFSNGTETAAAIGEDNMFQLYDQAIGFLDRALTIARDVGNATYEMQALGVRARAKHAKGIWEKLNPKDGAPSNPFVSGTGATADAKEALGLMGQDYKAIFDYSTPQFNNYIADQTNSRGEITLIDPFDDLKTGEPDPRVVAIQQDFYDIQSYTESYSPLTWLSAREMHLIIAEESVGSNDAEARDRINTVRSLNGLPPMEPDDNFVAFIEHERRANLFLQGRRLNDMYRFNIRADLWLAGEDAMQTPGTLLPIPANEKLANPNL
jgi:hypothetical protein